MKNLWQTQNTRRRNMKWEKKGFQMNKMGVCLVGFNCFAESFGLKIKSRLGNNVVAKRIN